MQHRRILETAQKYLFDLSYEYICINLDLPCLNPALLEKLTKFIIKKFTII